MKKILLINQHTSYLFIDIANEFCKQYDEVVLVAGVVHPLDIPLDSKVKVVKVIPYIKTSTFTRAASWVIGFLQIFILITFRYRKYELFISSNPPLVCLLPAFFRNKSSLLIYDVYPDGLVEAGFLKKTNIVIKRWAGLNKRAFNKAKSVITLTDGMANLLSKYVDKYKINVIPAWAHTMKHDINATGNTFIKEYDLENKFLIIYSGNLGKGYDLESLILLAASIHDHSGIKVIIAGEGYKKDKLAGMISDLKLNNCLMMPSLPGYMFKHMLRAMQIGVVCLENGASQLAIPSKTYNILGAGKPIICLGSGTSDLAALISKHDVGACFSKDEKSTLTEYVKKLYEDSSLLDRLSYNALKASDNFTIKNAALMADKHASN